MSHLRVLICRVDKDDGEQVTEVARVDLPVMPGAVRGRAAGTPALHEGWEEAWQKRQLTRPSTPPTFTPSALGETAGRGRHRPCPGYAPRERGGPAELRMIRLVANSKRRMSVSRPSSS